VPQAGAGRLYLPPVSLPELFQNALKHNTVALERPLRIHVHVEDGTLVFENELRAAPKYMRSTGIGLTNLAERFRIATGRTVSWGTEGDRFVVRLPLVHNPNAAEPAGRSVTHG
jgi:LytS/YehU family sensor histidine kinase